MYTIFSDFTKQNCQKNYMFSELLKSKSIFTYVRLKNMIYVYYSELLYIDF